MNYELSTACTAAYFTGLLNQGGGLHMMWSNPVTFTPSSIILKISLKPKGDLENKAEVWIKDNLENKDDLDHDDKTWTSWN